jgi:hypothetical protein
MALLDEMEASLKADFEAWFAKVCEIAQCRLFANDDPIWVELWYDGYRPEDAVDAYRARAMLAQIKAPHFTAGIVLADGKVATAAPIVKYMVGWPRGKVRDYCKQKKWQIEIVKERAK